MSDAVVIYKTENNGSDFVIVDFNHAAEKIENKKRKAVLGKYVDDVFPGIEQSGLLDALRRVWTSGEPEYFPVKSSNHTAIAGTGSNYIYKLPSGEIVSIYSGDVERLKIDKEFRLICQAVEQTGEGVAILDLEGRFQFVNSALAKMHGYKADELIGQHHSVFHSKEQLSDFEKMTHQLADTGYYEGMVWHTRRDGTVFPTLMHVTVLRDDDSRSIGIIGTVRDLTERVKAEKQVVLEKNKLQAILGSMRYGVTICDRDYNLVYQNNYITEFFGNCLGKKCYEVFGTSDSSCDECPCEKTFEDSKSHTSIKRVKSSTGEITYWENIASPIRDADGEIISCLQVNNNITERKKTERQMMSHRQKLRDLASQLSLSEERQRRHIAANLHDHISQWLAISILKLDILRENIPPGHTDQVDDIAGAIHQTIASIRSMIFDLSSPTLYRFGLEAAVFEFMSDLFKKHESIGYEFISDKKPKNISQDISVLLFQAVRELLFNVVKYAKATKVIVEVKTDGSGIIINVSDDGIGFDVNKVGTFHRKGGFGIFNIVERLDYIGGNLDIQSEPGKGSRFTLKASLDNDA